MELVQAIMQLLSFPVGRIEAVLRLIVARWRLGLPLLLSVLLLLLAIIGGLIWVLHAVLLRKAPRVGSRCFRRRGALLSPLSRLKVVLAWTGVLHKRKTKLLE